MKNVDFWKPKLIRAVQELYQVGNTNLIQQNINYKIQFDTEEKQPARTNEDEMIHRWFVPDFSNEKMALDDVLDLLVTFRNSFPLFVKIESYSNSDDIILLIISKRFRKWKDIQNWHTSNELAPFIIQLHK